METIRAFAETRGYPLKRTGGEDIIVGWKFTTKAEMPERPEYHRAAGAPVDSRVSKPVDSRAPGEAPQNSRTFGVFGRASKRTNRGGLRD